jgi:hypothetical protein
MLIKMIKVTPKTFLHWQVDSEVVRVNVIRSAAARAARRVARAAGSVSPETAAPETPIQGARIRVHWPGHTGLCSRPPFKLTVAGRLRPSSKLSESL